MILRGRAEERSAALGAIRRVGRTGHGAVLVITGEPGIGKTALLHEICQQAARHGFAVGSGKSEQVDQIAPAAPLLVALRSGPDPLLDQAAFGELSGLYGQHLWFIDRIAGLLQTRATRSPVLIALDDVQWADPLSRLALRLLPGRLVASPVLWLLAGRERGTAGDLEAPATSAYSVALQRLELQPLAGDTIDDIAQDWLGTPPSEPLRRRLQGVGGNPFLATAYLSGVQQARRDGRAEDGVPRSLIVGIRRSLASLSPAAADLVRAGAVWGRHFEILDAAALTGADPGAATEQVEEAITHGLLTAEGDLIGFRHDLVRESIYLDLPQPQRRRLHRRCAERLLETHRHWETGSGHLAAASQAQAGAAVGDTWAADILAAAADEVIAALPTTAAQLSRQSFELVPRTGATWLDAGQRCALVLLRVQHGRETVDLVDDLLSVPTDADTQARLQVIAAQALLIAGDLEPILPRLEAARNRDELGGGLRARLDAARALALTRTAEPSAVARTAQAALLAGRESGDRDAQVLAVQALADSARNEGRHAQALQYLRTLSTLGSPEHLGDEVRLLQLLDRYDEAETILAAAVKDAEQNQEALLPTLLNAQLWQAYGLGRLDETERLAQLLIQAGTGQGPQVHRLGASMILSATALLRGDVVTARERLSVLQDSAFQQQDDVRLVGARLMVAWVCTAEGRPEQGIELLKPLLLAGRARRRYWPWWPHWARVLAGTGLAAGDAEFTRLAVELAAAGAEHNPAAASFQGVRAQVDGLVTGDVEALSVAVDILRGGPRPLLLADALTDLGALRLSRGEFDPGRAVLDEAWDCYDELGAGAGLMTIRTLLRQAGLPGRPGATQRPKLGWSALTPSETRVAELIGAGHTNRSAAQVLGVSINTVGTQLQAVFTKLEVRSRVQLSNRLHERRDAR